MKKKLAALMLLAGGAMFAQTRFSVGVSVGSNRGYYAPAPAYATATPPCPGPGYTWVNGYWSQDYGRRNWVAGYWRAPARVAPRFVGHDHDRFDRGRNNFRSNAFDRR
jgi:hypothetical protein